MSAEDNEIYNTDSNIESQEDHTVTVDNETMSLEKARKISRRNMYIFSISTNLKSFTYLKYTVFNWICTITMDVAHEHLALLA